MRKSQEQVLLRFDPLDPSGASASFNPLEEIRHDTLLAMPDVQNMAAMLVAPKGREIQKIAWSQPGLPASPHSRPGR
jgi:type IV secretion system protein VirD4